MPDVVLVVVGSPGIEGLGGLRLLRLRILRILRMRLVVIVLSPIVVPLPTELRLLRILLLWSTVDSGTVIIAIAIPPTARISMLRMVGMAAGRSSGISVTAAAGIGI